MADFADAYASWSNWCDRQERQKKERAERARWCASLEGLEALPDNPRAIADYYGMQCRNGAHSHAHAAELAEALFAVSRELLEAKRELARLRAER
jgi:hypothetical protein